MNPPWWRAAGELVIPLDQLTSERCDGDVQLQPVRRRSVSDDVAEQLADAILGGDLAPGRALPGERELAEALGVSRPTVRTALQRLAQRGLVDTRHGGGSTVADFRSRAGLDLLPHLLRRGAVVDPGVLADVMAMRSTCGVEAAGRAADAGDPEGRLGTLAAAVAAAQDAVARQRAALALWEAVVELGGSIVHRLLFNSLRRAYEPAIEALAPVMAHEVDHVEDYQRLADAVAAGDAEQARRIAATVLGRGHAAVSQALATLPDHADRADHLDHPDHRGRPVAWPDTANADDQEVAT